VVACTVNAFKARLDKFWQHQAAKFDFAADLTNWKPIRRSHKVILFAYDHTLAKLAQVITSGMSTTTQNFIQIG